MGLSARCMNTEVRRSVSVAAVNGCGGACFVLCMSRYGVDGNN